MLMAPVLSVLPKKFIHFHSACESVEESKKSFDNLSTRLLKEEIGLYNQEGLTENSSGEALLVQTSNKNHVNSYPKNQKNQGSDKKDISGAQVCS